MGRKLVCDDEIRTMDDYLKSYTLNQKLLRMDRYDRTYFGYKANEDGLPGELTLVRAKMYEVRHFIMNMKNSDEKLLLYYHYIRGESVGKCAELLGISRSSAFRLKKRALIEAKAQDINTVNGTI
ncbi:MAG: DUF1492 domain-containing protein [Clostridia bacterium]|nr:DUF1492 domain-containing protein [Clostridia bacterium]